MISVIRKYLDVSIDDSFIAYSRAIIFDVEESLREEKKYKYCAERGAIV